MKRLLLLGAALAGAALVPADARAFQHVTGPNENLAELALRYYGSPRFENALAGANALDAHGGSAIKAGQPIEIPAPTHRRTEAGDTWPSLAKAYLGDAKRADTLARANGAEPWVAPAENQEIEIPAVIPHIVAEGETVTTLAQRYYNDANRGWELDLYNGRPANAHLLHGDVVLVPLLDLALTEEGKRAARTAADRTRTEGGGEAYEAQRRAEADVAPLAAEIRAGRYVEAVARGNRLLGSGDLTKPQLATIHRALLEAYVALEAPAAATAACAAWRANGGETRLDPRLVSPKIRAACK